MLKTFLAIFLGGGFGSVLRYGVQLLLHERIHPYIFPWSTLTVNIIGSFVIGLFFALSAKFHLSEEVRFMLTTGICGGFTTFSTFSADNVAMLRQGEVGLCFLYILVSIAGGLSACWLAQTICRS